jgi:5'-3' exonuclease
MGVPKFYKWVKENSENAILRTLPNKNDEYLHTLEFDMGGIIHECAATVYSYGDKYKKERSKVVSELIVTKKGKLQLEQNFYNTISDRLVELTKALIKETNSTYKRVVNLVIAMDGVAVFGKIAQQRSRRYKSTNNVTLEKDDEENDKKDKNNRNFFMPPPAGFDTNAITPGSELLENFDLYMKAWLTTSQIKNLVQKNIIYSSSKTRGEGEHKIFEMRRNELYGERDEKGIIAMYGLDADLIMLNCLSNEKNVYIIRERNKFSYNEGNWLHAGILNIDLFRINIVKKMSLQKELTTMKDSTIMNYIRDFVFLCFLIGNDFLPHIMCLVNVEITLDILIENYNDVIYKPNEKRKNMNLPNTGFITKADASINWYNLLLFLEELEKAEPLLLKEIGKPIKTDYIDFKDNFDKNGKYIYNPVTFKNSIILKNYPQTETNEAYSKYVFSFETFRTLWYSKCLAPKTSNMMNFLRHIKEDPVSKYEIEQMCKLYFEGLQWNLMYYVLGYKEISRSWYYTYTQGPLIKDLVSVLKVFIELESTPNTLNLKFSSDEPNFGPVHQLLSVMPRKSLTLINKNYSSSLASTMDSLGTLGYICPIQFKIDYESAIVEYMGLCILPIVDPWKIVEFVKNVRKPNTVTNIWLGKEEEEHLIYECNHYDPIQYKKDRFRK